MRIMTLGVKNKMISICIPTYEMRGKGAEMLRYNLDMIKKQTFKDFEVVISDNSKDDKIKDLCTKDPNYSSLPIKYIRNPRIGMAQNTNEAIRNASGEIIKILYMDDYLSTENSLQQIKDNFKGHWMVSGCKHDDGEKIYNNHFPKYNSNLYLGKNTIGSPSVLSIKNKDLIFFDENMSWLLDCDYYKRLYDKYGEPTILNELNVVIGTGKHQVTSILPIITKIKEAYYMAKKYKAGVFWWLKIW